METTIVETTIVETTRPRVVRVERPVLPYYDCGDDTPSCRPSRKTRSIRLCHLPYLMNN